MRGLLSFNVGRGSASAAPFVAPALALLASLGGCQCGSGEPTSTPTPAEAPPAPVAAAPASGTPATTASEAPEPPRFVGASQILVAFKGAELASPTVTRSREAAKARAEEALAKLVDGKATFEELASQYSDDPTRAVGGVMGNFERRAMPPAFADAAFALDIGQTSGVVETARGFHIVRRSR
jgi:peptidyl-prolyl cis-trans isomerase NIMA-interacting 1